MSYREISIKDARLEFKNENADQYEFYNEQTKKWEMLNLASFMERNNGFPVPEKANQEICLIQFYDSDLKTMFVLGNREWKHQNDYDIDIAVKYIACKDECELIETYLTIFKKLDPLIIYAWNGAGFDFPYMYNRLKNIGFDTNRLSNYGQVKCSQSEFQGRIEFKFSSDGHFYIDLMVIYKKFVFKPRASYGLNAIAEIELGDKKIDHSEYEKFDDFYSGNYTIPQNPTETQLNSRIYKEAISGNLEEVRELAYSDFVYYGIKDTLLILRIDNKLKFTQLQHMIAEKMGVLFSDATGTVKPWSQYILNRSYLNNQIMPMRSEHEHPSVVGGYVRDPEKGKHKWIVAEDVDSMYPLLGMVGFNMSPETYVPINKLEPDLREVIMTSFNDQDESRRLDMNEDKWAYTESLLEKYNYSLGINGAIFSKDKIGMIPEMVLEIYGGRKKAKRKMLDFEKQKILIKEIINKKKIDDSK